MRGTSANAVPSFLLKGIALCILLSSLRTAAFAQSNLPLREFVLFGANSTQVSTSTTVNGGRIGSYQIVRSVGNTNINASIHSNNLVQLANSSTVRGDISARNSAAATGNIFTTGSNFSFPNAANRIDVGGNVSIQSGTVRGTVFMPASAQYSGPRIDRKPDPVFPTLPALPDIAVFPLPGTEVISSTRTIQPNRSYNSLLLDGSKTLTFDGPGIYTFTSIRLSGSSNRFVLDFKNTASGFIVLQVHGDADLDKLNVQLVNGGSADRVYMEVHGSGATLPGGTDAWRIANGSSGSTQGIWYGTVWAPNGGIFVGQGASPSKVEGSLWSGTNVTIASGVAVTHIPMRSYIEPINPNSGKVGDLIGHELTNITKNLQEAKKHLILLDNDKSVLIEAVAVVGKEEEAKRFLVGLKMTDFIPNGLAYQVISGKIPIASLPAINTRPDLINHCRPVFQPVGNAGTVTSQGDKAMAADLARAGFNLGGQGVKIGVISDSYDRNSTQTPSNASIDITNGDLPGAGNPDGRTTPVHVLREYPYGQLSDEGRAMLQIIHDVVPEASLAFRTGFLSAGDMALGIIELKNAGCKVIVDDVTYPTEPFFQDGVLSRAVNTVNQAGVAYFTSAGNFGQKSYTSTFRPAPAPAGLTGKAHNFGNNDIYQRLKLKSGTYTIVLQWQDDIYSLAQTRGTSNDLDIYLVDEGSRIGFNRNNLAGDPFEVLSFSINLPDPNQEIEADLMVIKANESGVNPLFKYIIFRGNAVIAEYFSEQPVVNKSTIVGHANAEGSIAVGAVLYSNTAPFSGTPGIASFSSSGGTPVFTTEGRVERRKPEIAGPQGANTPGTVVMGPDVDFLPNGTQVADGRNNFFGTSAAAPHVAAAAALVINARKKFYNQDLNPTDLRFYLFGSALRIPTDGRVGDWDFKSGFGLVQPDAAIRAFANPTPRITELVYNASITPGAAPFLLRIKGEYLSDNSVIYFRGQPLTTVRIDENTLQAEIPKFDLGNPPLNVFTPSFQGATGDGGLSNTLYFFSPVKLRVAVNADNKVKKYGEVLPQNTFSVTVNGKTLQEYNQEFGKNLTLQSLGLENVRLTYIDATINPLTNVGEYRIDFVRPAEPVDPGFLELYEYQFNIGTLRINKLAVTVSPVDLEVAYGDALTNFNFDYKFDPTASIADLDALTDSIRTAHQSNVDNTVLGVMNSVNGGGAVLFGNQLLPVYNNAAIIYQNKLYPVLSGTEGKAVVIIAGTEYEVQTSRLAGGGAVVILNDVEYPIVNGGGAVVIINGEILPVVQRIGGGAVVILNDQGVPKELVVQNRSGGAVVIFNNQEFPVINRGGGAVVIFNGQYLPVINRLGGGAVVILNGTEYEVQTSRLAGGGAVVILNDGKEYPVVNSSGGAVTILNGKLFDVTLNRLGGGAVVILNGVPQDVPYFNGAGGGAVVIFNGKVEPVFNRSLAAGGGAVVILNGKEEPVVQRTGGGAVVILNNEELPVVNSVSLASLSNISTSATDKAIANARIFNGQANKIVDVAANSFVQFNAGGAVSNLANAYAHLNARTLVDANRLVNRQPVQVNRLAGGGAVTILNGSEALVNSNTLSSTTQRTPVVVDQADLNSTEDVATISMKGLNMITGIDAGIQYIVPATLFSPNFDITYKAGTVVIDPAPLALRANNLTKLFGENLQLSPLGFVINGTLKYNEQLSLAQINSEGALANAAPGTYPLAISNAIGRYGTDVNNYAIQYQPGVLTVNNECPVLVHSRNNSFVNTSRSPVSLWLSVNIKVRGQLATAGDYIELRSGRLVLENIIYENANAPINVPSGLIIATAGIAAPISHYDVATGRFITRVPVGYNSTADVFITGAIVNSSTGFIKAKNSGSVLNGVFRSNVDYAGQWNYSMAAYSALTGPPPQYVQYAQLSEAGSVTAVSGSFKAGTPIPWIRRITAGGTGNGGTNYTGSPSNYDNFAACTVTVGASATNRNFITAIDATEEKGEEVPPVKDLYVFPNPANDLATIAFVPAKNGHASVRVFNATGMQMQNIPLGVVYSGQVYTRQVETGRWSKGVYVVQLIIDGKVLNRKLMISR